jgi:hypothetical protein
MTGQQLLWTEQSDPSNLDSIVWPRAAASAEVGIPYLGLVCVRDVDLSACRYFGLGLR